MNRPKKIWHYWLFLTLVAGCSQQWQYSRVLAYPYRLVWENCQRSVCLVGYSIASDQPQQGRLQSEWLSNLYPLRGNGYRTQVILRVLPVEDQLVSGGHMSVGDDCRQNPASAITTRLYRVQVRVVRQRNYAHHDWMNPGNAIWLADGCALDVETSLIKSIESRLNLTDR